MDVDLELGEQGGALGEALRASVLPRPGERLLQRLAELLAVVVPLGLFDAEHQPVDEPIGLGAQPVEGVAAGDLERLARGQSDSSGARSDISSGPGLLAERRSEEHTSELQSLIRNSYTVLCLK